MSDATANDNNSDSPPVGASAHQWENRVVQERMAMNLPANNNGITELLTPEQQAALQKLPEPYQFQLVRMIQRKPTIANALTNSTDEAIENAINVGYLRGLKLINQQLPDIHTNNAPQVAQLMQSRKDFVDQLKKLPKSKRQAELSKLALIDVNSFGMYGVDPHLYEVALGAMHNALGIGYLDIGEEGEHEAHDEHAAHLLAERLKEGAAKIR